MRDDPPRTESGLTFYFDFISPYAYIAWSQVKELAGKNRHTVTPVPILFAALLDAHGQKGPAEIAAKRIYTFKDAYRKAHRRGLALVPPPTHPFNPLLALRVASLPRFDGDVAGQSRLIDALFDAAWSNGTGVEKSEAVIAAAKHAGFDGAALVEEAKAPETKERLRARTMDAIAKGVFGVPTLTVNGEIFWGTDGIDFAEACLLGDDPCPRDLSWAERPASAMRKT